MYSFSFVVLLSNASAALPNKAFQHVDTRNYKVRVCVNGCEEGEHKALHQPFLEIRYILHSFLKVLHHLREQKGKCA
ncbi:unnamed protein product [Albugo candida]|uniref:Secreted protein n=1 Tax=Albugo candida TaxID=65357 RepID=A0A024GHZ6_9STRA|nr:unnamed protein product [Albugo candida]|eukprot:CCI46503.1 unnamed protein product [Albugo candida]